MNRLAIIFGATLALATSGAFAQITEEPEDDNPKSFEQLDQNNDGVLEELEVADANEDQDFEGVEFDTLDEDENGEVSNDEWVNYFRNNQE